MSSNRDHGNLKCQVDENVILDYGLDREVTKSVFGDASHIRAGSIIYAGIKTGQRFQAGHNVTIRSKTVIGDHVVIGTNTVIEGDVEIGSFVSIQSNCFIPTHTKIGCRVFIGPNVVMTNDKYPLRRRDDYSPQGPVIEDNVSVGAGAVLMPGITVGEGAFVAGGAVVTKDIEPNSLVVGNPGKILPLPENLQEKNLANRWKAFVNE